MMNFDNVFGAIALSLADRMTEAIHAETGFSATEAATLVQLHFRPNRTIKALAAKMRLSHPGAVRVLDRLESRGLVERSHGSDKRQALISLTTDGERAVKSISAARQNALSVIFRRLTHADKRALAPILEKLVEGSTRSVVDAYANCRFCDTDLCYAHNCPVEAFARERFTQDFRN